MLVRKNDLYLKDLDKNSGTSLVKMLKTIKNAPKGAHG